MLTEKEKRVLETIGRQLLITKEELIKNLTEEEPDGIVSSIQSLKDLEYIDCVEPVGETCFVITQKGMKALRY